MPTIGQVMNWYLGWHITEPLEKGPCHYGAYTLGGEGMSDGGGRQCVRSDN